MQSRYRQLLIVCAAGWFCSLLNCCYSQEPAAPTFLGRNRCSACHKSAVDDFRDFVSLTESATFLASDKHALAYEYLEGELGKQICKTLKIDIRDDTTSRQCLSCHANWLKDQAAKPPFVEAGVSCESCHGPGSRWDGPHSKKDEWRKKSAEDKTKDGMIDVRQPVARAQQCLSCHLGNVEQGKIITHDMYAAGHPPLPSIEIESFVDQMPAHWRYLPEKGEFEHKDAYLKANYPSISHDPDLDLPRTRATVIGGLVVLRESLELFAGQSQIENPQWPELAQFDCQACHHDLRSPSWRQQRDGQFAPGRPMLPEWPWALASLSLRHLAGDDDARFATLKDEFLAQRRKFVMSIQKQPFGDRKSASAQAAEFAKWLEPHIKALSISRYDQAAARRAVRELTMLDAKEFPDFHSARQRAWALGTIQRELDTPYPTLPALELTVQRSVRRKQEDEIVAAFEKWRDETFNPKRQAWADRWIRKSPAFDLPLRLPAGQKEVIARDQPHSLQAISNYDAAEFRKLLEEFRKELK